MSVQRIRVVNGATRTGLYGAANTINVVLAPSPVTGMVGLYHPCGAYYVTVANDTLDKGAYARDGSLYVTETLTNHNGPLRVIVVSGSLGSAGDHVNPTITSSATASVSEGSHLSISLTADESVTWSIAGGADSDLFEISTSTLRWLSNGTQTFATPLDANGDNIYEVSVQATDTNGNYITQAISVTVTAASGYVGPLDLVSGALVAYGQRALSAAKRGQAIYTLKRSSDDATQEFNSDASTGVAPVSDISAFVGVSTGTVIAWNDHSASAADLGQYEGGPFPYVWNASLNGGKSGMEAATFDYMESALTVALAGGAATIFAVSKAQGSVVLTQELEEGNHYFQLSTGSTAQIDFWDGTSEAGGNYSGLISDDDTVLIDC